MKKIIFASLPILLLTSCSIFSFSKEKHDEGFSGGGSGNVKVVEYFEGDTVDTSSMTEHVITFAGNQENNQPELKTDEAIKAIMTDADSVVSGFENIKNISQFHALKVGHLTESIDGELKINLNINVKAAKLMVRPRAKVVSNGGIEELTIDSNNAVSVNGSKYIRINNNFTTMESITDTTCMYSLIKDEAGVTSLDLSVVYQRVEITSIYLYE